MLTTDDQQAAADLERFACEVAAAAAEPNGVLSEELTRTLATAVAESDHATVLGGPEPTVAERHEAVDLDALRSVSDDLAAAFMVDLKRAQVAGQG